MTQTVQARSRALLGESDKDLTFNKNKGEAEDNVSLLLSVLDSMNKLCEALKKLDYLILSQKDKK